MQTLLLSLILIVELVIQGTVFQFLNFHGYYPDLILLSIICLSIIYEKSYVFRLGLIIGLSVDILYGNVFGFYGLSFLITSLCVSFISRNLYIDSVITPIIMFPVGTVVFHSVNYFMLYLLGRNINIVEYLMQFGVYYWIINFVFLTLIYHGILKLIKYHFFRSQIRS